MIRQYFTELIFSDLYIIYIFIKKKKESVKTALWNDRTDYTMGKMCNNGECVVVVGSLRENDEDVCVCVCNDG